MFSSIFLKSALAFGYRCLGAGVTFLFGVFFARVLNIEDYGVLVSLMSLALIGSTVALFGQHMMVLRDLPSLVHRGDDVSVRNVASRTLIVTIAGGAIVTAIALAFSFAGFQPVKTLDLWACYISFGLLLPLAIIETQSSIGRSFGSVNMALVPKDVLWRLIIVTVAAGFLFLGRAELHASHVLAIAVATLIVLIGVQQLFLRRVARGGLFSFEAVTSDKNVREWLRRSMPFWVTSVANILFATLDIYVVSIVVGPEASGYYYAANRISLLLDFFLTAFSIPAASIIARLYDEQRRDEIGRVTSGAALLSFVCALSGFVVLLVGGEWILKIFGPRFDRSYGILLVLSFGQVASAYLGVGIIALNMTGHQWAALRIMVVTSVVALIMMSLATFEFGVWGAAVCAAAWIVAMKVWMALHLLVTEGIDTTATTAMYTALKRLANRVGLA